MKNRTQKCIEFIVTHRRAVLVVMALVIAGFASQMRHLAVVLNADDVVPPTHEFTRGSREIERNFGLRFSVLISVTANDGNVYQPAIMGKVRRLTDAMLAHPLVIDRHVFSLTSDRVKAISGSADGLDVKSLVPNDNSVSGLKEIIEATPLYQNTMVSADRHSTAVVGEFRSSPKGFNVILQSIQAVIDQEADDTVTIRVGGHVGILAATETMSNYIAIFFPLALLVIACMLYGVFGNRQALILPLATALIAVIMAVSVLGWLRLPLDAFNAVTPVLILAVVVGHSVQIMKKYTDEYRRLSRDKGTGVSTNHEAIVNSLTLIAPVTLMGGLVASAGFFSLLTFAIPAIRTFGLMAGWGILFGIVLELVFIPALRACLAPPATSSLSDSRLNTFILNALGRISKLTLEKPGQVLGILVLVLSLLIGGTYAIIRDNSNKSMLSSSVKARQDDEYINRHFAGTNVLYVQVDGKQEDFFKQPSALRGLDEIQRVVANNPAVGKALSITDQIKRLNQALNDNKIEAYRIPDTQGEVADLLTLYSLSGDGGDFDTQVTSDYQKALIQIYIRDDSTQVAVKLIETIRPLIASQFGTNVEYRLGGNTTDTVSLDETMIRDKITNILQISAILFVMASVFFRSLVGGLLVTLPAVCAVLVNVGVMGWLGIPFNVPTSLVSAMVVGLGSDFAIYLLYAVREQRRHSTDNTAAILSGIQSAGPACLYTALSIAAGFSMLMLSRQFVPHMELGGMLSLAMITSVAITLIAIPAILALFKPSFLSK